MTPYQAQRIRFGVLAARHMLERWRLTPDQVDYLEGCCAHSWKVRDSYPAYKRERDAIRKRAFVGRFR